jgi:glycosyltransferase involved in cell wall biosynthesis
MRVLVAVIAFNEEKNIVNVLNELNGFRSRYNRGAAGAHPDDVQFDVVVIDNASTDSTDKLVRSMGVPLVRHPINSGGSMGTVLTYFRYADQGQYDVLIQFDGDGQHIAAEIPNILEPIVKGQADYVIGSRYIERKGFQSTAARRFGIRMFNRAIKWACGEQISDSTSGFRAYNRRVINLFARKFPHELTDPIQLLIISKYCGIRIREVPTQMRERLHGFSEFDAIRSLRFVINGMVTVFGCRLQREHLRRNAARGIV